MSLPRFSADTIPGPEHHWRAFRKHAMTRALRIEGPFIVDTSEGPLTCQDGWLCIDARGYPYPVADDEFQRIYGPAPTVVEQLQALTAEMVAFVRTAAEAGDADAARAFALARTHLEDARVRYTEGRCHQLGTFSPADVDKRSAEAERAAFHERIDAAVRETDAGEATAVPSVGG